MCLVRRMKNKYKFFYLVEKENEKMKNVIYINLLKIGRNNQIRQHDSWWAGKNKIKK